MIIVDMLEDSFKEPRNPGREEEKIVQPMHGFLKRCRSLSIPVIFANDSFLREDFLFKGRLKPYAIRGTAGEQVLHDLAPEPTDIILPKRRFSAFFKTDLDQTLRTYGLDTVAIGGINTPCLRDGNGTRCHLPRLLHDSSRRPVRGRRREKSTRAR